MGWIRHAGAGISVALLASVMGHVAIRWHFEERLRGGNAVVQAARHHADLSRLGLSPLDFMPPPLLPPDREDSSSLPRLLGEFDRPTRVSQVVPALQIRDEDESAAGSSRLGSSPLRATDPESTRSVPPRTVLAPHDATALSESPELRTGSSSIGDSHLPTLPDSQEVSEEHAPVGVDANAVRRVIEEELVGSSREERDIWYDELKSIPAGVVRDLLQVRKQLRSLPRALHKPDAPAPAAARGPVRVVQVPVPNVGVEAVSQTRRQPLPDWTPTVSAVEQALTLARHNVANSLTPGFQRVRWQLVDAYGIDWNALSEGEPEQGDGLVLLQEPIPAEGCRLVSSFLEVKQGKLLRTGRSLDLAIDGSGFFPLTVHGKPAFTRCGALVLNTQRRLCLSVAGESAELQPPIVIPAEAQEIQVTAQGEVLVLEAAETAARSVGQLRLARFACPERLRPLGATLLGATKSSGEPNMAEPESAGRGVIQQGCLENSNVDMEAELADIERLQALLKSLPTQARPVTASSTATESR